MTALHSLLVGVLVLISSLASAQTQAPTPERPNILFIVADDQAPWAYRASGNDQAHTPHMDTLAREGIRFTSAFTPTPVCSPARASIMTSRYGSELAITDWINPKVDQGVGLADDLPTWPRLLQAAGYETALFGKWHLGDLDSQHPTKRGYGTFMGFRGGGNKPKDPTLEKEGVTAKHEGFVVDIVAGEAIGWLKKHDATKPFAMSIHFREPHSPYLPVSDADWKEVEHLDNPRIPNPDLPGLDVALVKKLTREYLASVAAIDRNLGEILEALEALNLKHNTLVIYTSDHGYNMGHNGIWHKGNGHWILTKEAMPPGTENVPVRQRPNMFDNSVKVPLILRWPAVIKPGTVSFRTVSHLDWLPTLAALGRAPIPQGTMVRGRDFSRLLRGDDSGWDDGFYAEYSTKHQSKTHMRMYRTPEWKLIRDFNNEGRDELYNVKEDPEETKNLFLDPGTAAAKARTELDARILEKMAALNDPVLPLAKARLGRN